MLIATRSGVALILGTRLPLLARSAGVAIGCATAPSTDGDGSHAPIQIASKRSTNAGLDLAEVLPGDFAQNEGRSAEKLTIILFIVK